MVDLAVGVDGQRTAVLGAGLALVAVGFALEAEPAERAGHGQRGAQRADVLAVRPLGEDGQSQDGQHEEPIGPAAVGDAHQEGGLEGLHLGQLLGLDHREQRHGQQHEEHAVLHPLQPVVPFHGQQELEALETDLLADDVQAFLQRAERAGPAAEQASSEDEDGDEDEDPEQEQERVAQEQRPFPLEEDGVEPGEHLRDRRLRQQPEAHPEDAEDPERILEAVDRPLVLAAGQPGESLAEGIDHGNGRQHGAKKHQLYPLGFPLLQPGRIGANHLRMPAHQILGRQPVFALEGREGLGAGAAVELVAQETQFPWVGGRETLGADDEDAGFGIRRSALGLDAVQVLRVGVAEGERVVPLVDLDAVIDAAPHEARALEGLLAVGADDEDGVLAFLQVLSQVLPGALTQDGRTHDGGVERAVPQLDEGRAGGIQSYLLRLHHELADGALLDQRVPVGQGLTCLGLHILHRLALDGLEDADLACHGSPRSHDDLVLGHHGDGGARDGVHADHVVLGAGLTHLDVVLDGATQVLVVELQQRRLRNAQQEDRLGVLEHLHADILAVLVHPDQRDDRLAGIGGRIGDVGRQHHITQHLLAIGAAQRLHVGRLALALRE